MRFPKFRIERRRSSPDAPAIPGRVWMDDEEMVGVSAIAVHHDVAEPIRVVVTFIGSVEYVDTLAHPAVEA